MPAWKSKKYPVLSSAAFIKESREKDVPLVLIDLRTNPLSHIPGAVSSGEFLEASFPSDKNAPIVLYSEDNFSVMEKFKILREWGYRNAAILEGGFRGWESASLPVEAGQLKTEIVYIPKPRPGEITIEEFKKIADNQVSDKLILDVRGPDEARDGAIKGSLNIPAGEIGSRLGELPRDKELIAYCATGVRAEMAYNALKEAGLKARYLNAVTKIDSSGQYEITKE